MSPRLHRLLGGAPGPVLVKLIFLSLLVGAFIALLGLTPLTLLRRAWDIASGIFGLGFDAVRQIGRWLLYGAVIVVPIWLVGRLFGKRN
jgi:hypothetical protein